MSLTLLNYASAQDFPSQQLQQRTHPAAHRQGPVGHVLAANLYPQPLEDLFLPIQRQRIAEFAGQDEGNQPRGGQALGDQLRHRRGDLHRRSLLVTTTLAVMASVLGPHVAKHLDLGRDDI
jgi:hypothetical protein